jgi:hypothetical protein
MKLTLPVGIVLAVFLQSQKILAQAPTPSLESLGLGKPVIVEDEATTLLRSIGKRAAHLVELNDFHGLSAMGEQLTADPQLSARGRTPLDYMSDALGHPNGAPSDQDWQNHLQFLREWSEKEPNSLVARICRAYALISYAWQARGIGLANTVTPQGWQLMDERLTEARQILEAAERMPHDTAAFYTAQLDVALGDGRTSRARYDEIFAEGVRKFPTSPGLYGARAIYLSPSWHGRPGELETFAKQSADRFGGEDGDVLYTRIVWKVHDQRLFGNIFQESSLDWLRTQRGFEALCHRYPNSLSAISEYCSISGFAPGNAQPLMQNLFLRVGNRVDLGVWKEMQYYVRDRLWAAGRL